MKKIIFNGLVLDMYNGDYACSRGCYSCDKSKKLNQRKELNIVFLNKIKKYFIKHNIVYSSISFNMLGNFFYNINFFSNSIYIFLKLNLIKPKDNILLYTKLLNKDVDYKNIKIFFSKFTKYFNFTLGITIDLGEKYFLLIEKLKKIDKIYSLLGDNKSINLRLIIQKSSINTYSKIEKEYILNRLKKKKINIYLSEEEAGGKKADLNLKNLFTNSLENKCLFLKNNSFNYCESSISLDMLNISEKQISFHWPSCFKVKNLHIGKIGDDFETIDKNINKVILKIKKLEKKYNIYGNNEGICNYCIKNF